MQRDADVMRWDEMIWNEMIWERMGCCLQYVNHEYN